jgi:hypothetical protein
VLGGTAAFYGTRVPVQTLLDYLEAGDTIDDFLEGFPSDARASHCFPRRSEGPADRNCFVSVLPDECVDWRLRREPGSHEVKTARHMGWTTLKNGELLALASVQFDVFAQWIETCPFNRTLSLSLLPPLCSGREPTDLPISGTSYEASSRPSRRHCRARPNASANLSGFLDANDKIEV